MAELHRRMPVLVWEEKRGRSWPGRLFQGLVISDS